MKGFEHTAGVDGSNNPVETELTDIGVQAFGLPCMNRMTP
jgi:hypothetical protein